MHEATRRLLGVLLRHLDGFETNKRSVVIAATNRKEDLDPALLSRWAWPLVLPSHRVCRAYQSAVVVHMANVGSVAPSYVVACTQWY